MQETKKIENVDIKSKSLLNFLIRLFKHNSNKLFYLVEAAACMVKHRTK